VSAPSAGAVHAYQTGARNAYAESQLSRVAPRVSDASVPLVPVKRCAFAQSSFAGGGGRSSNVHDSCVGPPGSQSSSAIRYVTPGCTLTKP